MSSKDGITAAMAGLTPAAVYGAEAFGSARPIPDRHVVAGIEQALRHRITHPADADPTDLLLVLCHAELLWSR